jgi:cell division protein FtsB
VVLGLEISRKLRQVLGPLLGATIMAYFTYHAIQGDRGLIAWWNLRYEIERVDAELMQVGSQKEVLDHRVSLLRPESLDRDMLEERARLMLGAIHPKDLIVPDATPNGGGSHF